MAWAFGALGIQDRARHFATLYLNDVADVLREAVEPHFEFVRYAESLAQSQPTFAPLAAALAAPPSRVDEALQVEGVVVHRGRRSKRFRGVQCTPLGAAPRAVDRGGSPAASAGFVPVLRWAQARCLSPSERLEMRQPPAHFVRGPQGAISPFGTAGRY